MSALAATISAAERAPLPDAVLRLGVSALVEGAHRKLAAAPRRDHLEAEFARAMAEMPVAIDTEAANAQHYEVPAAFFGLVLGSRRKYSACLYGPNVASLDSAEARALSKTCEHADLKDGQDILELGCGWGSLSLWMAKTMPGSRITAVSNSASQRAYIEDQAREKGVTNLTVITADMNHFEPQDRFDRVVSVEMFEHMSNWRALLGRIRGWLKPQGRLFIHVFSHRDSPYRFDDKDEADWIGRYFFTGGVMPSHGLIRQFGDLFKVEADWNWDGRHYQRTALAWLANFDRNAVKIRPILSEVYGAEAELWFKRWRLFFLATAGLFGHRGGKVWGVSHYLLAPV